MEGLIVFSQHVLRHGLVQHKGFDKRVSGFQAPKSGHPCLLVSISCRGTWICHGRSHHRPDGITAKELSSYR